MADGKPVMVIASGLARLDRKALADFLGVSRRRVKIASAEQVLVHTGYVAGSVPPFGYREPIETVLETAVLPGIVYGGGWGHSGAFAAHRARTVPRGGETNHHID